MIALPMPALGRKVKSPRTCSERGVRRAVVSFARTIGDSVAAAETLAAEFGFPL